MSLRSIRATKYVPVTPEKDRRDIRPGDPHF
jgi:hypothetical protein